MKEVTDRLAKLWDALYLFYFGFLKSCEQFKHKQDILDIYKKYNLNRNQMDTIENIFKNMKTNTKTKAGTLRRDNILLQHFQYKQMTMLVLQLYRGILNDFSAYVKIYQAEKLQCHRLHTDMYDQLKSFYSGFIEPSVISDSCKVFKGMKHLAQIDVTDRAIQVRDRQLALGQFCLPVMRECLRDIIKNHWINDFYAAVRKGYVKAAEKMKKMPLLTVLLYSCQL